jgi:hypothetical protein
MISKTALVIPAIDIFIDILEWAGKVVLTEEMMNAEL